jgi:hypothetical protein
MPPRGQQIALVDLLDRLLAGGVVITGDITISIANVDLVRISLRAIIASIRPEMERILDDQDAGRWPREPIQGEPIQGEVIQGGHEPIEAEPIEGTVSREDLRP